MRSRGRDAEPFDFFAYHRYLVCGRHDYAHCLQGRRTCCRRIGGCGATGLPRYAPLRCSPSPKCWVGGMASMGWISCGALSARRRDGLLTVNRSRAILPTDVHRERFRAVRGNKTCGWEIRRCRGACAPASSGCLQSRCALGMFPSDEAFEERVAAVGESDGGEQRVVDGGHIGIPVAPRRATVCSRRWGWICRWIAPAVFLSWWLASRPTILGSSIWLALVDDCQWNVSDWRGRHVRACSMWFRRKFVWRESSVWCFRASDCRRWRGWWDMGGTVRRRCIRCRCAWIRCLHRRAFRKPRLRHGWCTTSAECCFPWIAPALLHEIPQRHRRFARAGRSDEQEIVFRLFGSEQYVVVVGMIAVGQRDVFVASGCPLRAAKALRSGDDVMNSYQTWMALPVPMSLPPCSMA